VNDSFVGMDYPHHAALSRQAGGARTHSLISMLFGTTPPSPDPVFLRVLHVVRCPMRQISAVTTHLRASYVFLLQSMVALDFIGLPSSTASYFRSYGLSFPESDVCAADASLSSGAAPSGAVRGRRRLGHPYPPRGSPCWLRFSASAWLFWHRLIDR
jgi:hypothetical protein